MFGYTGFNNLNMYSFNAYNMFGGCCNPYGSMMAANCLYNPFMMINTATQLMNGNFPIFGMNYAMPQYTLPAFGGLTSFANTNFQLPQGSLFDDVYYSYGMGIMPTSPEFNAPILSNNFNETDFSFKGDLYNNFGLTLSNRINSSKLSQNKVTQTYKPEYTKLSASHLTKDFLSAVKKSAAKIGCDYEDLLAVMNSESSLDPAAVHRNRKGEKTAVGLIQFTKNYAIPDLNKKYNLNLTVEKIEKMSAIEQLDLVEKFYEMNKSKFPAGKKVTAADLYAVTYLPARAERDVLCRRGERKADGKLLGYYESNQGLDMNNDGKITKEDLNNRLAQKRVSLSTFA